EPAIFICQQCACVLRAGEQMDIRVRFYHPAYARFPVESSLSFSEGSIHFPAAFDHRLEHGYLQLADLFRVGIEYEQPFISECIMDERMEEFRPVVVRLDHSPDLILFAIQEI